MFKIEADHAGVRVSGYVGMEDLDALEELKNVLIKQADIIPGQMLIDLTNIEHFDVAGLQLLLAVRQKLHNLEKRLILETGDELVELLALTGLDWVFQPETSESSELGV